jgi:hypothetical protein
VRSEMQTALGTRSTLGQVPPLDIGCQHVPLPHLSPMLEPGSFMTVGFGACPRPFGSRVRVAPGRDWSGLRLTGTGSAGARCPVVQGGSLAARPARSIQLVW